MLGQVIRQLQELLEEKARSVQRQFVALSEEMSELSSQMHRLAGDEHQQALVRQKQLRNQQQDLAEEINLWRDYTRQTVLQGGEQGLRRFVNGILERGDDELKEGLQDVLFLLDNPEEVQRRLEGAHGTLELHTPVARLVERARTNYDLRSTDSRSRHDAAIEFAGRPGVLQDQAIIAELEACLESEQDKFVIELVNLSIIRIYRYRAVRLADMDAAHEAVKNLSRIQHPGAISALIDVLESPRTGFSDQDGHSESVDNTRSRTIALLRLVEWHTAEARQAIYLRRFDQDSGIANLADKAISLFPGEWTGSMPAGRSTPIDA